MSTTVEFLTDDYPWSPENLLLRVDWADDCGVMHVTVQSHAGAELEDVVDRDVAHEIHDHLYDSFRYATYRRN